MIGTKAIVFALVTVPCILCSSAPVEYVVQDGDTLWKIARIHKIDFSRLCELNGKPTDWSLIHPGEKIIVEDTKPTNGGIVQKTAVSSPSAAASTNVLAALQRFPLATAPKKFKHLSTLGEFDLFAGDTEEDATANIAARKAEPEMPELRNSLFARRRVKGEPDEWRLIMTSGGVWTTANDDKWGNAQADSVRRSFFVIGAHVSRDGRGIWMVCDANNFQFALVCYFNLAKNSLRILTDGDTAEEQPDGTIRVKNKKTYLYDKNGDSLGAAWYDEWITPEGKVLRKTSPKRE